MTDRPSLKTIRHRLGFTVEQMARALGYTGENAATQLRRYEAGTRDVPEYIARLALMYFWHGVPAAFTTPPRDDEETGARGP